MGTINNKFHKLRHIIVALCVLFLTTTLILILNQENHTKFNLKDKSEITPPISKLQIPFVLNEGQFDENVKFYANTFSGTVFITKNGDIVYSLPMIIEKNISKGLALKEYLVGGKIRNITGQKKAKTKASFFKGKDRSIWRSSVSTYNLIDFDEVYDGIEMKLRAYGNNVEKLFYIKPGAKPEDIRLKLSGVANLKINNEGELEMGTELGVVSFTKPVAYQVEAGEKKYVEANYSVNGNEYGFEIRDYNTGEMLVIDPLLASTFIGGSSTDDDYEPTIVLDHNGNVYLSGYTYSSNFPTTPGVYNENYNGGSTDRFVAKFDSNLENLLASTFIGGTSNEYGMGMQVTNSGYVYLAGYTTSNDFPTITGSYDETYNGGRDAFVLKLDDNLTTLLASTYLGGNGDEGYQWPRIDLVIGESNNVYVTGLTKSNNFPFTPGANDSTYAGGSAGGDVFVSKFDNDLTTLLGSTYLGGNMDEWRVSIALDENENIYVCGETLSSNFPTTQNSYDPSFNGGSDIFISKFTNDLTSISSSTFLGANNFEEALTLKLNRNGIVYIAGYTMSPTFPFTPGVYDSSYNGGERDAYIAKFNDGLTSLLASTFIGGNNKDTGEDITIGENRNIYLVGVTLSSNFPTTPGAYDENHNGGEDVFISRLDSNLSALLASTFVGSAGQEKGQGIALDDNVNVYVAGRTTSSNFPFTPGAYDTSYNGGGNDCFIIKFDSNLSASPSSLEGSKYQPIEFELYNNYPNPFNPVTTIKYDLPIETEVILIIYSTLGQEVRTLVNELQTSGNKLALWDGTDNTGKEVSTGIYIYILKTKEIVRSKKMVFLK